MLNLKQFAVIHQKLVVMIVVHADQEKNINIVVDNTQKTRSKEGLVFF
jgi:hypothetical protein